ncbi:MAG TPA: hypothetical protein VG206_17380 [Terriglobia bacterium]|nr:hypothetical protein [Terriglobia bacterium]
MIERCAYRLRLFVAGLVVCSGCLGNGALHGAPVAASEASGARPLAEKDSQASPATVAIPGPMRSFLRMAGISQKASPEEVLPLLARNVVVHGFDGQDKSRKPTEYLVLLRRYLDQARELEALAGPDGVIQVPNCEAARPLLAIIGYRLRDGCEPDTSLATAQAERAFITIDSGFPLSSLEESLGEGKPFALPFSSSRVPVLFRPEEWTEDVKNGSSGKGLIDLLVHEPAEARLYWALSQLDPSTAALLWRSPGHAKLVALSASLDFYGSDIYVRSGRVIVPGGTAAESSWKSLAGASPDSPSDFIPRLLGRDKGWLAAYFDALSRVSGAQQAYFTEPHRLRRFYEALCGRDTAPGSAGGVFRPNAGLLLLVTRLELDSDGRPHVPGGLDAWKEILQRKSDSKLVREWGKRAGRWKSPEQVLEAMFAISREESERGPVQVYLTLSEIDRERAAGQRLAPQTVSLLAEKFPRFHDQYRIFSEFHALNDTSIVTYFDRAEALDRIGDRKLRADALGIFEADTGLWQIMARQGEIPGANWDSSWQQMIEPFTGIRSSTQLFDAARTSLGSLFQAATGKGNPPQDEIIALLAGPEQTSAEAERVRQDLANHIRAAFDAQQLVSLDTIRALGDGLSQMAQRKTPAERLIPLAGQLREFELPKPLFTTRERSEWVSGLYNNYHTQDEMQTNLSKIIKSGSPNHLAEARGLLVPFLRDSLVGLNYAYYEPPGAQMLHHNPLFVRSHDFAGAMNQSDEQVWASPTLFGRGWTASGGAHLAGSLADLPYVLAQVEQDFIVPENTQSLIWEDVVPCLVTSAVLPRWWRVTGNELHAVALYQRFGEELVSASAHDEKTRHKVMDMLADRVLPRRFARIEDALRAGRGEDALAYLAPSETFYLGTEFLRRFPEESKTEGASGQALVQLGQRYPKEVNWERLSQDFGVPHPALAQTYSRELLNVKPFPTFLGYSSRLLAESWDSSNLYWARLADEMGYQPAMLHRLVPELTHRMVEKIFATDLEDWPALLRALRETGEEFRTGKIAPLPKSTAAAGGM